MIRWLWWLADHFTGDPWRHGPWDIPVIRSKGHPRSGRACVDCRGGFAAAAAWQPAMGVADELALAEILARTDHLAAVK